MQTVRVPCQLPYPERYDRALLFYNNWPQQAKQPTQDTQLILFGLSSQVAHGPCREPQPSGWNTLEHAKWTAWHGLANMDKMEAMRLFVKTLEEDEVPPMLALLPLPAHVLCFRAATRAQADSRAQYTCSPTGMPSQRQHRPLLQRHGQRSDMRCKWWHVMLRGCPPGWRVTSSRTHGLSTVAASSAT